MTLDEIVQQMGLSSTGMGMPTGGGMGQPGAMDFSQPGMMAPPPGASSAPYAGEVGPGGYHPFIGDMSKSGTGMNVTLQDMLATNPNLADQAGSLSVPYSGGGFTPNTINTSPPPAAGSNPGINWSDPAKQAAIRSAFADPNNDPAKISAAMREWGVSNDAAMAAMGWDRGQFDKYFQPLFGPQPSAPSPTPRNPNQPVPGQVPPRTWGGSPFVPSDAVPGKYGSGTLANQTGASSLQALIDSYQGLRAKQQSPLHAVSTLK